MSRNKARSDRMSRQKPALLLLALLSYRFLTIADPHVAAARDPAGPPSMSLDVPQAILPLAEKPIDSLDDISKYAQGCFDELAMDETLKGFLERDGGHNCRNRCIAGNSSGRCTVSGVNCDVGGAACADGRTCIARDCTKDADCGTGGSCKINGLCTKGAKAGRCSHNQADCARPWHQSSCGNGNMCVARSCSQYGAAECGEGGTCSGIPELLTTCETATAGGACAGATTCKDVFNSGTQPASCDNPSWLSNKCYGHTYVQSFESHDTHVAGVFLCRHKDNWSAADDDYDDMAMIWTNRQSGKTCWFQNKARDASGVGVPNPTDGADAVKYWATPKDNAAIGCVGCHDNGPFMNSPWIRRVNVVPGDGHRKYKNPGKAFESWPKPTRIEVGDEGDPPIACTSCHTLSATLYKGSTDRGDHGKGANQGTWGRWAEWVTGGWRFDGTQRDRFPTTTNACGQTWARAAWMPRSEYPVLNPRVAEGDWNAKYGKHLAALKECADKVGENLVNNKPPLEKVPKFCKLFKEDAPPARLILEGVLTTTSISVTLSGAGTLMEQASLEPGYEWAEGTIEASLNETASFEWASQGVTACSVVATLPGGLELNGVSTGTNWATASGSVNLGSLRHHGVYIFRIDCDGPYTLRDSNDGVHAKVRVEIPDPSCTIPFDGSHPSAAGEPSAEKQRPALPWRHP